ncbi:MAG: sterol desaturase family protein [Myxococcota bacterium]
MAKLIGTLVLLAGLCAVMAVLARRWPAAPGQKRTLRDTITDVGFLVFNRVLARPVTKVVLLLVAGAWAALAAGSLSPSALLTAFSSRSALALQPLWLQTLEVVLLGDFIGYWVHRAFHHGELWRYHAVHHSPERLDWLSSPRLHPVNDLLGTLLRIVPLFVLGFDVEALAITVPGLALYGLLLHANVWWRFGALRYVVTTPAFHRWHHAAPETLPVSMRHHGANFAGVLPLWDLLFRTYHLPAQPPARCGVDEPMADGMWGLLRHPWRRDAPRRA